MSESETTQRPECQSVEAKAAPIRQEFNQNPEILPQPWEDIDECEVTDLIVSFLDDRCICEKGSSIPVTQLYKAYRRGRKGAEDQPPASQATFHQALKANEVRMVEVNRQELCLDIRLLTKKELELIDSLLGMLRLLRGTNIFYGNEGE
jgi:hypothetical protein